VDFWMAVGALRESFVRRWVARVGERPREVKVSRSEERGALEGVGGGTLSEGFPSGWGAVVEGFEEKREETTSAVGLFGPCLGRDMVDPSSFCLLAGCVPLVSGSLTTAGTALLPVKGPNVWVFWPWYRALFFAVNRSLQRPPLKTVFAPNIPSPMDKFISMPSSAMVVLWQSEMFCCATCAPQVDLLTRFVGCPSKSVTNGKQRSFQLGVCPGPCTFRSRAHPKPD